MNKRIVSAEKIEQSEQSFEEGIPPPSPEAGDDSVSNDPNSGVKNPSIIDLLNSPSDATDDQLKETVSRYMQWELEKLDVGSTYNILFLYDSLSISRSDANRIYQSLPKLDQSKPILLVIKSFGGNIAAAYFIAKLCREFSKKDFHIAVPREAKSAATLICCGADKIHMGSLSELGPIDPQFGGVPALALKHSIEHIAELVKTYPDSVEMFAKYLSTSMKVDALGYYERVAESATQYAVRLLNSRNINREGTNDSAKIARRLVYDYKDHGFVIDASEALDIFSSDVVETNTLEYIAANKLYTLLDFVDFILRTSFNRTFYFTGDVSNAASIFARNDD